MHASRLELIRFGYGAAADDPPEADEGIDAGRLLAQLDAPDPAGEAFVRPSLAERFALFARAAEEKKAGMIGGTRQELKSFDDADAEAMIWRPVATAAWFRERLVNFWANRFTVATGPGFQSLFVFPFREEVARAHVAGRFADMALAAIWHPAMHVYLNQTRSVGPNSLIGKRKGRGLNENLAREFLELHTMGTGYTQADVTELARLLAGMYTDAGGSRFAPRLTEPGEKTVLGVTYGGAGTEPEDEVRRLVENVAMRPETAQSLARALARHFVADAPPADLVEGLAAEYLRGGGELRPVYAALLAHPAARSRELSKVRWPLDYVAATLRAAGITSPEVRLKGMNRKKGFVLATVLARMGQRPFQPRMPNGWPETAEGWMTPPMLAARIDWATDLAQVAGERADPAALTDAVMGGLGGPLLRRAVSAAEQRWEGMAVLFASPGFMRR